MKLLIDLVYVVSRNKVKRINLLDLKDGRGGKVNELYQAIYNDEVKTDADARRLLFPTAKSASSLSNTKRKLLDKLLRTLFFIDTKDKRYTDRQSAYFELQKDLTAANLLMQRNAIDVGVWLMEKNLETALFFEFPDIVLAITRRLRLHYGPMMIQPEAFAKMDKLCRDYTDLDNLTLLAEEYYAKLFLLGQDPNEDRVRLRGLARRFWQDLKKYDAIEDYGFRVHALRVELFSHTILNDYESCIDICNRAIAFFESKKFDANPPILYCLHHLLVARLQQGDYVKGLEVAERTKGMVEPGSFNWFRDQEYLFLLGMHAAMYPKAYEHYTTTVGHPRFEKLDAKAKQSWKLYAAFLDLLEERGLVKLEGRSFEEFDPHSFRKSMRPAMRNNPVTRFNVSLLQLMYALRQGTYDEVLDGIEVIRREGYAAVNRPDSQRVYRFVQLLLLIPHWSVDPKKFRKESAEQLKLLEQSSRASANPSHKLEIIPFEELWAIILKALASF